MTTGQEKGEEKGSMVQVKPSAGTVAVGPAAFVFSQKGGAGTVRVTKAHCHPCWVIQGNSRGDSREVSGD